MDSSDRVFRKIAEADQVMVYPHYKRLVTLRKPKFISYKQKGELKIFNISEATAKHELLQPQPNWFRKLNSLI